MECFISMKKTKVRIMRKIPHKIDVIKITSYVFENIITSSIEKMQQAFSSCDSVSTKRGYARRLFTS